MSWQSLYRTTFGEEPSPAAVRALDEIARIAGPDDPFFVLAMFHQRQIGLLEDRSSRFLVYAGEIDRVSGFLRDRSNEIGAASTAVTEASDFVTENAGKMTAAVKILEQSLAELVDQADAGTERLEAATVALRDELFWWRLDLKLVMALTVMITMCVLLAMAFTIFRSPSMTVETAAAVLVGSAAAPNLIELQQRGDLKALLDCTGEGWRKEIGYCRPVGGNVKMRGWNIAPSASPPERAASFDQK